MYHNHQTKKLRKSSWYKKRVFLSAHSHNCWHNNFFLVRISVVDALWAVTCLFCVSTVSRLTAAVEVIPGVTFTWLPIFQKLPSWTTFIIWPHPICYVDRFTWATWAKVDTFVTVAVQRCVATVAIFWATEAIVRVRVTLTRLTIQRELWATSIVWPDPWCFCHRWRDVIFRVWPIVDTPVTAAVLPWVTTPATRRAAEICWIWVAGGGAAIS